jgi:glutamine amidotransferase
MCRHSAWLGQPATLQELLVAPEHGLVRQSWAPRHQRHGVVNADGFGIGWYDGRSVARYRRAVPIWGDASFLSMAPVIRSRCVLAAVRSATVGGPGGEEACAPFLLPGGVLLSHNGAVPVEVLAPLVPSAALAAIGSTVDSAFLAALVADRLPDGLVRAVSSVVREVGALAPDARLNLLCTDGSSVVGTAWGDSLWWGAAGDGIRVGSEPSDDEGCWTALPDRTLLHATPDGVSQEDLS